MKTVLLISIIVLLIGIILWQWYNKREKERKAKEEQEKGMPKEGFRAFLKLIKGLIRVGKIIKALISRTKHFVRGIIYGAHGVGLSIKNVPIIAAYSVVDGFSLGFQGAKYLFNWTVCTIEKLKNLYFCIFFYAIDFVIYLIFISVRSTLFFLDEFFSIPERMDGNGLVSTLDKAFEYAEEADNTLYSYTGYHVFRYPEFIMENCYRCTLPLNTKDLRRAKRIMSYNTNVRFPPLIKEYTDKMTQSGIEFDKLFDGI